MTKVVTWDYDPETGEHTQTVTDVDQPALDAGKYPGGSGWGEEEKKAWEKSKAAAEASGGMPAIWYTGQQVEFGTTEPTGMQAERIKSRAEVAAEKARKAQEEAAKRQQEAVKKFAEQYIRLAGDQWVDREDFAALPTKYQKIGKEKGFAAMNRQIELDGKAPFRTIAELYKGKSIKELLPTTTAAKAKEASKTGLTFMAEYMVPGVFVASHWDELSPGEKAFWIAMDVICIIPIARGAVAGARAVSTAGRAARVAGAARGAAAEAVALARAPIDIFVHPVGSAKSTAREIRSLVENLAHPKKIPEVVITTAEGTVRLKISQTTSAGEAMQIRDKLMKLAAKGERPIVKIGNREYELARSPLMKEAGGGLATASPQAEKFARQIEELGHIRVIEKPGMPVTEQGLFMSHEPLPRFAEASAFGKTGKQPVFIITSKETAEKAFETGKIYRGATEMELKYAVGTKLPAPAQKLFTRIGPESLKVEIWLEKPLTARQIAKLKAQSLIEAIITPFKPAIRVAGGKSLTLSEKETAKLAKVLKASGNADMAGNLIQAERMARESLGAVRSIRAATGAARVARAARVTPPPLSRILPRSERLDAARQAPVRARDERAREREVERLERRISERLERIERLEGKRLTGRAEVERKRELARERRALKRERARLERARTELERGGGRVAREGTRPRGRILRIGDRTSLRVIKIPKGRKRLEGLSDRERRRLITSRRAAVAFRMGQITYNDRPQDVWHVVMAPFTQDDYVTVVGRRPEGATIVRGPQSAYKTAQLLYGQKISKKITFDIGAVDATLTPTEKGVRLSFKADKVGTRQDIDISKGKRVFPLKK